MGGVVIARLRDGAIEVGGERLGPLSPTTAPWLMGKLRCASSAAVHSSVDSLSQVGEVEEEEERGRRRGDVKGQRSRGDSLLSRRKIPSSFIFGEAHGTGMPMGSLTVKLLGSPQHRRAVLQHTAQGRGANVGCDGMGDMDGGREPDPDRSRGHGGHGRSGFAGRVAVVPSPASAPSHA